MGQVMSYNSFIVFGLLLTSIDISQLCYVVGHEVVGRVSLRHIYEIAKVKQKDTNLSDLSLESVCKCVIGSARSMGIEVIK